MFRSLLKEERGYSLVEVMVAIMVLTIAIVPMISMFDMGLKLATKGSDYDKARALANLKLEEAKSLPFSDVENNFPETGTTYDGSGQYQSDWLTQPGAVFTNFEYRITKQYMAQPTCQTPTCPSQDFASSNTATSLIRVTVTVRWGNGNTFTTFGLRAA